jgi:ABC-type nitrate/sulfonate/bicarbonate transport system ATPase subunit
VVGNIVLFITRGIDKAVFLADRVLVSRRDPAASISIPTSIFDVPPMDGSPREQDLPALRASDPRVVRN